MFWLHFHSSNLSFLEGNKKAVSLPIRAEKCTTPAQNYSNSISILLGSPKSEQEEKFMGPNVLVADDSGTMRKIIIRSLQALGVSNATEAKDGDQAVSLYKQGGIDVILTDWNMPGKNGMEVLQEIRALDKNIPIVMVTTEAEKKHVLEAIQAGVSDYIIKPFEAEMLREKLKKFISL
jgi:two-component system, chemotaxis family, chemotaxis protein CheY